MPIKDKDGNVYKLRGPNPVMKEQEIWDKSKLKLINFDFESETVSDKGEISIREIINPAGRPKEKEEIENVLKLTPEPKINPQPIITEPEPIPIIEIEVREPPKEEVVVIEPEPVIVQAPPKESIKPPRPANERSRTSGEQPNIYNDDQMAEIRRRKITIYCLPVFDRMVKDDVYDDTYKIKSYGDKFTFEGVMVEEEDLFCRFWTNTEIPAESIVYPRNHSRRWWQVQKLEPIDGGWMVEGAPTHANPDFTD